MICILYNMGL